MTFQTLIQSLNLSSKQCDLLDQYTHLLLQWNVIHNLTGAKTTQSVQENILDSLYPLTFIYPFQSALDVGSGGGFPALPLSIVLENTHFILVEPRLKRFGFLQNVCAQLNLKNIELICARLQDIPQRDKVELITSRAVMSAPKLIAYSKRFLSPQGYYLFYKGLDFSQEMPGVTKSECFVRSDRIYFYKSSQARN